MEAAHITWRPLGRVLVEQGLLTDDELEHALARQQETGERLGETIVKCGFVSGPELAAALAAQYGIELTTEKGFGTGLRSEIQRRHESDRRRVVQLVPNAEAEAESEPEPETEAEIFEFVPAPEPRQDAGEAALLAQLEEQWAKLAAAEAALAEHERELAEQAEGRERELAERAERERELTERAESRERELAELHERRDRDFAEAVESRDRELTELAESRDLVRAELAERERELSELAASRERELAERAERERELTERVERRERELAELTELAGSRGRELAGLAERERELSELTESHLGELRRLEEVNQRLREQLEDLRNAPIAPEQAEPTPVAPASHLVFVQLDERYALISRDGPPPAPSTPLFLPDVDEGSFVVAGLRHSPLPGDERPCVFVHRG